MIGRAARRPLKWLRVASVVLTSACNLRCGYCYQNRKQPRRMQWETLRRVLGLLLASERRELELWFTGGEPLLQWPLVCRAVLDVEASWPSTKHLRFGVTTNGLLLDDGIVEFLAAHRFMLQVSFDGLQPAQDARGRGSFAALAAGLERLRRRQPLLFDGLRVAMTVTASNVTLLGESVQYFLDQGVGSVNIGACVTPDRAWNDDAFAILDRQFARICDSSVRAYQQTGRVAVVLFRSGGEGPRRRLSRWLCPVAGGDALTVDVDGSVVRCPMLVESYQTFPPGLLPERVAALRLGSVYDADLAQRFDALPKAARRTRLFDGHRRKYSSFGRCGRCRYRWECSVCPVSIGRVPGNTDPDRVPDVLCRFNRVVAEARSRFRARIESGQSTVAISSSALRAASSPTESTPATAPAVPRTSTAAARSRS